VLVADAAGLDGAVAFLSQFPAGVVTRSLTLSNAAARGRRSHAARPGLAVDRLTMVVDEGERSPGRSLPRRLPIAILLRCDGTLDGPAGAAIARFAATLSASRRA